MSDSFSTPVSSTSTQSGAGWTSDLPTFEAAKSESVCMRLADFVADADASQQSAWKTWVPQLQKQAQHLLTAHPPATEYTAILEYRMPRDLRRPDVIIIEGGIVVVLELKGLQTSERAGIDQVLAYARDLRAYHEECHERPVVPVLVRPTAPDDAHNVDGAWVVSPRGIAALLATVAKTLEAMPVSPTAFLRHDAYCPLPSIVDAARDLFEFGELPYIKRARACTDPALETISCIAHEAAATKTRHLVVLQGVPGSGKTLVGLQVVHARWLDVLAAQARTSTKRHVPAVYLTGNGPLQEVLQHALSSAGGGGKAFVQGVKKYVSHYSKGSRVPPEHVVVFDEAQRAHDAEQLAYVHKTSTLDRSEPECLLDFMARVPDWCVLVALVGTGQAIHSGEEVGLPLWREALLRIRNANPPTPFTVHAPADVEPVFSHPELNTRWHPSLNLDTEIRHHLVPQVHRYVEQLLGAAPNAGALLLAEELWSQGHRFLLTRDLDRAKLYVQERYADAPSARYGLIASSRCKRLPHYGVENSFGSLRRFRAGPWFNDPLSSPDSCRQLSIAAT